MFTSVILFIFFYIFPFFLTIMVLISLLTVFSFGIPVFNQILLACSVDFWLNLAIKLTNLFFCINVENKSWLDYNHIKELDIILILFCHGLDSAKYCISYVLLWKQNRSFLAFSVLSSICYDLLTKSVQIQSILIHWCLKGSMCSFHLNPCWTFSCSCFLCSTIIFSL